MLPQVTDDNVDTIACNYINMFKSAKERQIFYMMFKQNCIFKNNCSIDIQNMKINMT